MELEQKFEDYQPHFSFSSRGSSYSGFRNRRLDKGNMTTQWKQLYLSRAKLKAVSRTSALIAGFAMVAMVEVQLDRDAIYDPVLLILFSTVTTCLVAVHLFALMIATCMLPNIEAVSNIHNAKAISQSPHHKMRTYIEIAWVLSTGVGLVLFMFEIGLLIWLKFLTLGSPKISTENIKDTDKYLPAWIATAVLVPAGILFAGFAVHFYRKLAQHRYNRFEEGILELDRIIKEEEQASPQLHPNSLFMEGNNHQSVSRFPSTLSVQSQSFSNNSGPSIMINHVNRASN